MKKHLPVIYLTKNQNLIDYLIIKLVFFMHNIDNPCFLIDNKVSGCLKFVISVVFFSRKIYSFSKYLESF
jgi:hypothetical protein